MPTNEPNEYQVAHPEPGADEKDFGKVLESFESMTQQQVNQFTGFPHIEIWNTEALCYKIFV